MGYRKPHQLKEWRKISIAFTLGTLLGVVMIAWLIPFLVRFI